VKDLHSLSDTEGKMTDKSLAEAAFSEMDSDNDGVVTRSVLSVAVLGIRIRRIHMFFWASRIRTH
jgi:hypothetical protein